MTQQANPSVREVAEGVDRLVRATNEDLRLFQQEQAQLRDKIKEVVKDNNWLNSELARYQRLMAGGDYKDLSKRLKLTSEALEASKHQVETLLKERRSLLAMQDCSQRTISNMELELKRYRTQMQESGDEETIQQYARAVKMLEARLANQQQELRTQAETIRALHDHKQRAGEQLQQLQTQIRDHAQSQSLVSSLQKQLREYELSLSHTRQLLEESSRRESIAMRKVQDAIALSEEAERARDEAEKRAESFKEEVNQLAGNIGSIMDEAAKRVDSDVEQLKKKLSEKDKAIATLKVKLKRELAEHKSVVHLLETRNNQLEVKHKAAHKMNSKLEAEVEVTSRRLQDLERSLKEFHSEEAQHCIDKKHYESEIERYLESYKKLKASYRKAMDDITHRFEAVIYTLKTENAELIADNQMLRSGAAGDSIRRYR